MIDSGIDADHPAVGGVAGYVAITDGPDGTTVYDTEPHGDVYGHGTACAGIIRSLAPDVRAVQRHGPWSGPDREGGQLRGRPALGDRVTGCRSAT